ncbi:hypothetical protein C0J52_08235 [Blattella germanica]|nr:hypothetical protein C0J52_08235 [Blattella germanica]
MDALGTSNVLQKEETVLNSTVVPEGISHLRIENCTTVRVKSHTWEGHRDIRTVELFNISQLIIENNSFSWNETIALDPYFHLGLSINIFNSTIPEIPSFSFKGRLSSISLNNVTVGKIHAFAFASLYHTDKLELVNCVVNSFEAQSFKKFGVHKLYITGGYFSGSVPSRTMLDLEVHSDLFIDKLKADTIRSSAFIIRKPKTLRLRDCFFKFVEGEAFHVKMRGKALIQNNVFLTLAKGAFAQINVDHFVINREGLQDLRFENNTIQHFEDGCLVFDTKSFEPQMEHIVLNQTCSCVLLDTWSTQLSIYSTDMHIEQNKNRLAPHTDPSNPANPFWCWQNGDQKSKSYVRFYDFSHQCVVTSGLYIFLIIIVTSALVLLGVILLVILWCRRRRAHNQKRWINVPTSPNSHNNKSQKLNYKSPGMDKVNKNDQDSRITMVVPDGRTYRETELHVIVERTEPLLEPEYVDTAINERENKNYIETHH